MDFSKTPEKSRRKQHRRGIASATALAADDMMRSFKTRRCGKTEPHDPRLCFHYHSTDDFRRNPYDQYYSGIDVRNEYERDYHPLSYRVQLCQQPLTCLGRFCPQAHRVSELRVEVSTTYYDQHFFPGHKGHLIYSGRPLTSLESSRQHARPLDIADNLPLSVSSVTKGATSSDGTTTGSSSILSRSSDWLPSTFNTRPATSDGRLECKDIDRKYKSRLEKKSTRVLVAYGTAPVTNQLRVKRASQIVRDRILRLHCSHCLSSYYVADGCMAISCQCCTQWFCGWCHHVFFSDSTACHEHVRSCESNLSDAKSLFASPDEIECGQRLLRLDALKHYLSGLKKGIGDKILGELKEDLSQYNILPNQF